MIRCTGIPLLMALVLGWVKHRVLPIRYRKKMRRQISLHQILTRKSLSQVVHPSQGQRDRRR